MIVDDGKPSSRRLNAFCASPLRLRQPCLQPEIVLSTPRRRPGNRPAGAFDLFIGDYRMPGMDGVEFSRRSRPSSPTRRAHPFRLRRPQRLVRAVNKWGSTVSSANPGTTTTSVGHRPGLATRNCCWKTASSPTWCGSKWATKPEQVEAERLEAIEPGITEVNWGRRFRPAWTRSSNAIEHPCPTRRATELQAGPYGPAQSGRPPTCCACATCSRPQLRARSLTMETQDDRTLFFDLLPLDKFRLFTVPGQVAHDGTRRPYSRAATAWRGRFRPLPETNNGESPGPGGELPAGGIDFERLRWSSSSTKVRPAQRRAEAEIRERWSAVPRPLVLPSPCAAPASKPPSRPCCASRLPAPRRIPGTGRQTRADRAAFVARPWGSHEQTSFDRGVATR